MISRKTILRAAIGLAIGLTIQSGAALAQWDGRRQARTPDFTRFSITVGGGAAFAEGHQAIPQLLAELQYRLKPRFRLGLGVGYLTTGGQRRRERSDQIMPMGGSLASIMLSEWGFYPRQSQELGRDFRLVPISLNAYYVLPLARRWDVYLSGGASYYLGTFYADSARLTKNAWGGQAGIGVEFRLNQRIKLIAQGGYRFVEFRGLKLNQPLNPLVSLANASGFGDLVNWLLPQLEPKPVNVHLNGFNLTGGVRFGI